MNLAEETTWKLLNNAQLQPEEISLLASNSVTGLAVPSLEARLMNRIPFLPSVKRIPLFGLGCVAGVAGVNRVADYLCGHPKEAAIFVSVELCSLTMQFHDLSTSNLISSALFGDGCAAVLLVGNEHPLAQHSKAQFIKTISIFLPNTEKVMGWNIIDTGFQVILNPEVTTLAEREIQKSLSSLLESTGLAQTDIEHFIVHPGGPKVLKAIASSLNMAPEAFKHSWNSLSKFGNMSSVSVLHILQETLANRVGTQDLSTPTLGVMLAMGPGFCAELTLLELFNGH